LAGTGLPPPIIGGLSSVAMWRLGPLFCALPQKAQSWLDSVSPDVFVPWEGEELERSPIFGATAFLHGCWKPELESFFKQRL
jgi:hypothetical protein